MSSCDPELFQNLEKMLSEGDSDNALLEAEAIAKQSKLKDRNKLIFNILHAHALFLVSRPEEAKKLILPIEDQFASLPRHYHLRGVMVIAYSWLKLNNYEESSTYVSIGEDLYVKFDEKEKFFSKETYATLINIKGSIHWYLGYPQQAYQYFFDSYLIRKELGFERYLAGSLNNLGLINLNYGDFSQSFNYFNQALEIYTKHNIKRDMALLQNNLGYLIRMRGNLEEATKLLKKSYNNYESTNNILSIGFPLYNLGGVQFELHNYEQSLEYYQNALDKFTIVDNSIEISRCLFQLVRVGIALKDDVLRDLFLEQLVQLRFNNRESNLIRMREKLGQAFVLKNSERVTEILKAEAIFEAVIDAEIVDIELFILSLKEMSELLLLELKINSNSSKVYDSSKELIGKLREIGLKQSAPIIVIVSMILQSKFSLIDGDLVEALKIIEEAEQLAKEKDLIHIQGIAKKEYENISRELTKWKKFIYDNSKLYERIEHADLIDYLKSIQNILSNDP